MNTSTLEAAVEAGATTATSHAVCNMFRDIAVCGKDMTGRTFIDDGEEVECVVCADLEDRYIDGHGCPICGRYWCMP